jgi:hypothetical protein
MRWTFLISGCLQGAWMLSDAVRLMAGSSLGPQDQALDVWPRLFAKIGIDPFKLGPLFLLGGAVWLFVTLAVVTGRTWARKVAVMIAIGTLWYALHGTALSAIYLLTLRTLREPRKESA